MNAETKIATQLTNHYAGEIKKVLRFPSANVNDIYRMFTQNIRIKDLPPLQRITGLINTILNHYHFLKSSNKSPKQHQSMLKQDLMMLFNDYPQRLEECRNSIYFSDTRTIADRFFAKIQPLTISSHDLHQLVFGVASDKIPMHVAMDRAIKGCKLTFKQQQEITAVFKEIHMTIAQMKMA